VSPAGLWEWFVLGPVVCTTGKYVPPAGLREPDNEHRPGLAPNRISRATFR